VYLGSELVASGIGASKQDAEQIAAQCGLDKKQWMEDVHK
jgi:dsRNA-specific ribonuclease